MPRIETTACWTGFLVAIVCVGIHGPAYAQVAPPELLVRVATAATPPVTDTTIVRQRRVEIASLASLAAGARLRLDLFPDLSVVAVREGVQRANAALSWTGRLEGYPNSSVVLSQSGGEFAGHIHAPFGFFRIERSLTGGYLVQQVDDASVSVRDDSVPADDSVAPGDSVPSLRDSGRVRTQDVGDSTIDVMVVHTATAVANIGGDAAALTRITLLVAEANLAFRNSGVATQLRLVNSPTVDYEEAGDSLVDLTRLRAVSDGFLDELHAARDAVGADLVVLIVEQMEETICGRGYVNNIASLGQNGFSIVQRRCTNDGQTFAHEVGHNLGAKHDWYVDDTAGAFPYSHGVVSLPGRFRDLMSYANLCTMFNLRCQRLLAFSNPGLSHMGEPLGVPAGTDLSCNGTVPGQVVLQDDGNLVVYDGAGTFRWASGTAGNPLAYLQLDDDGALASYSEDGRKLWDRQQAR